MRNRNRKQKEKLKDAVTRAKELQICLWFAEMKTAQEVADLVKENFNIPDYTRQRAYSFSKSLRWARLIRFLKAKFLKDLSAIPIANKAFRIKALQSVYREALTESLKSINQFGEVYELKLGAAIEALKAAREEIEGGNKTVVDQSSHLHISKTFVYLDSKAKEEQSGKTNRIISQLPAE